MSIYIYIYILACFRHVTSLVLSYHPFYFLSASWTLAGAAELVSVVILAVYSTCLSSDFYHIQEVKPAK